ncbi:ROK family transcriptional regulator [Nonomuraea soli]|uniref:Putative NBD/HSP70 family sugar kinase n=1 Tax=Nonomuraea soli TaxID=1032476 RepID=A0A7W0CSL3_9ACTN|nr:ROK family transcriptional regulator [Nonomuraea soli]MBA2896457.1 putative NBD/HSP70 family sugar kinase [Nonomuraea soli]
MPADQALVRRANLSLVLRHLRERGPRSRAAVAAETGLNKTTVTSLVAELQARGLLKETGPQHEGAIGRPGLPLALDGSAVGALGVEVNVDYIAVFATDLGGRVLIDRRVSFDAMGCPAERTLTELDSVIRQASDGLRALGVHLAGITVAVPGLVDTGCGIVVVAPNLGWHNVPVAARLSGRAGQEGVELLAQAPITVDNDANLAALAEHTATGVSDLVYLTGEVGVGGGIIAGGRLLGGADGFAGEVGHVLVDPGGERCGCGRSGCWETKVGLAALIRKVSPEQAYGTPHQVLRDPEERLAELQLLRAAGEPGVEEALAEVGRWLGRGAATLVNLFNPRVIVLGGYFAQLAEALIPVAQEELERIGVAGSVARCRFVASGLGFGAASRGAAGVVVQRVLADPTLIAVRP